MLYLMLLSKFKQCRCAHIDIKTYLEDKILTRYKMQLMLPICIPCDIKCNF